MLGKKGARTSEQERKEYVKRIHKICDVFAQHNMYVLLETHPNTLTDTLPATIELLEEVNHPNLKINLDFLHIWESGADPIDSFHH